MADLSYSIDVQTREAVSAIADLKTALAGLASAFAIREIVQFSDSLTAMRNRLSLLTTDLTSTSDMFNAIGAIAMKTKTPLEAVGTLFTRIANANKELGFSLRDSAKMTEAVALSLSIMGTTSSEAASGMIQLTQALGAGVVNGDELRSILENMPMVADALAESLGKTRSQLREMGSQGKITGTDLANALLNVLPKLQEQAGGFQVTIGQAFENLKTGAKVAFDEFERNTATGKAVSAVILSLGFEFYKLARNIDAIIEPLKMVAQAALALLIFTAIGRAVDIAAKAFSLLIGTGSKLYEAFTNLKTIVGVTIAAIEHGVMSVSRFKQVLVALGSVLGVIFDALAPIAYAIYSWTGAGSVIDWFSNKVKELSGETSKTKDEQKEYNEYLQKYIDKLDDTEGKNNALAAALEEVNKKLAIQRVESRAALQALDTQLSGLRERLGLENSILDVETGKVRFSQEELELRRQSLGIDQEKAVALQRIQAEIDKLRTKLGQLTTDEKNKPIGKELAGQLAIQQEQLKETERLYNNHREGMSRLTKESFTVKMIEEDRKRTSEMIVKLIEDQTSRTQKLGDILRGVNDKIYETLNKVNPAQLIGKSALEKEIINIEKSTKDAAQAAARQLAQAYEGLGDDITPQQAEAFAQGLDQIIERFNRLKETQIEQAKVNATLQKSFDTGWSEAFAKYAETAKNAAEQAQSYFSIFTKGIEDAIVRFVQTGKLSFKDLANNIIAEFVRIQVRSQMMNIMGGGGLLSRLFGGFGGIGFGTGLGFGNLDYGGFFAKGGTLGAGKFGIAGEAGPEIVSGPATITPMSQLAPSTNITYNINAVDAASFRALVARDPEFIYQVTEAGRRSQPSRRLS